MNKEAVVIMCDMVNAALSGVDVVAGVDVRPNNRAVFKLQNGTFTNDKTNKLIKMALNAAYVSSTVGLVYAVGIGQRVKREVGLELLWAVRSGE